MTLKEQEQERLIMLTIIFLRMQKNTKYILGIHPLKKLEFTYAAGMYWTDVIV